MKKIKDAKINKTYSKLSIWMLKQLLIGIVVLIIALVTTIYREDTMNLLGQYNKYFEIIINFIVGT